MMIKKLVAPMLVLVFATAELPADDNWPQFRGCGASGIGTGNPPVDWDIATGKNLLWNTPIDGLGHSSPIVWGDRVFITTAVNDAIASPQVGTGWLGGTGQAADDTGRWSWQVHCYGLEDGRLLWKREVVTGEPLTRRHLKATHANSTPATDGKFLVVCFGSEGLYGLDMDGNLKWRSGFGRLHSGPYDARELEWGFASSPVIYEGHVILQCDCLNMSFVTVVRLEDGCEVRRIPRNDVSTWSTPQVARLEDCTQIVCNGFREMAGYDFDTGEKLWYLSGGGDVPVPSPLYSHGLFLLTNAHGRSPIYAVSPSARGDLSPASSSSSNSNSTRDGSSDGGTDAEEKLPAGLVWYHPRDGSYIPTPIVVGELLYTCNDNGRLTVTRVTDGSIVYQRRVGGGATYSASAVGTAERLYFVDESGTVHVVKTGSEFEQLARNEMQETVMATPAMAGDRLLIRTTRQLVCIGNRPVPESYSEN